MFDLDGLQLLFQIHFDLKKILVVCNNYFLRDLPKIDLILYLLSKYAVMISVDKTPNRIFRFTYAYPLSAIYELFSSSPKFLNK